MPEIQEQLKSALEATHTEVGAVLRRLQSGDVDPVELVGMLESLALLDQQRADLLERARHEASTTRRRDEERSIRQFVLRALEEIGVPQTAGFLEDYVYARERVVLNTRGFGALRRDEARAWRRRPGHRRAYIVPCLDATGRPVPRWMARSDWPLAARVVVPEVEALWTWTRVMALARGLRDGDDEAAAALYAPLIEKYARDVSGGESGWSAAEPEESLREAEREAAQEVDRLDEELSESRSELAARFAGLDIEQQLWGVSSVPSGGFEATERGGSSAD